MGYTTDFTGKFKLNKQLSLDDYKWLKDFAEERHEGKDAEDRKMPGIWCQWIPSEDGWFVEWDKNEKFYDYIPWLEWLIRNFFKSEGYILNGEIEWEGEDQGDVGKIIVKDNLVKIKEGRIVYE